MRTLVGAAAASVLSVLVIAPRPAVAEEAALAPSRLLVDAFNRHDAVGIASLVTDDFELYYVMDDGIASLATRGPAQLETSMTEYFDSRPTVRSEIVDAIDGPRFATFRERVWSVGGRDRAQSSVAVYEVRDGLIARAWYFPAEPDAKEPGPEGPEVTLHSGRP